MGLLAKNDQDFFKYLERAHNGDKAANAKCIAAIHAFMTKPKAGYVKKVQAMGVSTDFTQITKESFNVTIETDNFDMGWERAFRQVTLGDHQDSWEIYDVTNGLSFKKVEEGQKIEVAGMAGSSVFGTVDYYGGALGWTDKMIRFRKIPAMMDIAQTFRNRFWENKGDNHYTLISAATGAAIATQGSASDGKLQQNIETINYAANSLGNALKDKGYGDMANAPLVMYANPFDEQAIEAAFRATTAALAGGTKANVVGNQIGRRPIQRIYTYNSNIAQGYPVLLLPGNKLQKADAMQPTTFTAAKDILTLNEAQAVWAIYGGVIADTDQVVKLTLA